MGESGKLKLGEACRVCGHFRGQHGYASGCLTCLDPAKVVGESKCKEGQVSILEHALSETDAKLEALIAIEAARGIFERSFRSTQAYRALDEDLKERIKEVQGSLFWALGVETT